ncbi:hypothetical protein TanjilG_09967 [Lupinus angustifolius]|uniref:FAD synthase n=1 Tax=Lupinus angustifolius TaxID=3871 RepID=A0A1J7GDB2_LUPAN|nr:hypothetical protein TanjilG_09967 [Lupinus angustifolius]
MEIDKAITGCGDQRLQTKYNNATYVIQRALALYPIEEVAFSFNGGKDSTVLLHLLRAGYFLHKRGQSNANGDLKDFPIRTIYFESPCTFPEINSFTYDTAAAYDLQIDTIRLDFKSGLEALLKENPIRAIFLGVRIGDPTAILWVNMEIDKAITGCGDQRLQTKYNNATYVIQRALALYPIEEVAFSFNGGKDSTVLLHLLRAGYFLHKRGQSNANGDLKDFPIRTIYFESPCTFPEINSFTYDTAAAYDLQIDTIRLDFKSGLEALLKENPIRAIFLGVRIGDPTAVGQEQFSPSSPGWPPFMRVNPILDWSYRDIWAFLLTCKVKYCSLYDQGYTSIGSIYDTVPNSLLSISNSSNTFKPAYLLADGRLERAGRVKKLSVTSGQPHADNNRLTNLDLHKNSMFTASIIAVGDEILFGTIEDQLGPYLCRMLHSIGWSVLQLSVVHNNIDCVAEEVERKKSTCDMVFIYGGVGPLHSDVTLAGIAKAFGVRLAPDEEFEEYLRHIIGDQCIGDRNEMAQLPEGITELLHHDKLSVPLVEIAQPLSKLCLEFPDLYIGCYRKTRYGYVVVSFKGKAVINYGASWCHVCSKILPAFSRLSNDFPKLSFIYADIDECPETTQLIRYTPTFQFFRDGQKVDEMYGAGEERLHDRLWLHS